jgi:predicted porin
VRGTEDLGGGLKAFFQLETGFRPDSNDTTFAARNSGVGLQGGWGSVLLGRWDSRTKLPRPRSILWRPHDRRHHRCAERRHATSTAVDQNVVQYWSPSWGGFAFRLSDRQRRQDGDRQPARQGAQRHVHGAARLRVHRVGRAQGPARRPRGRPASRSRARASAARSTFGPVKIGGQYQESRRPIATSRRLDGQRRLDRRQQPDHLSVHAVEGRRAEHRATQPDCDSNTIGYQYNFSRRTFFLAQYAKVDNNDAASCNFGANRLTIANGQDPQAAWIGIRHIF